MLLRTASILLFLSAFPANAMTLLATEEGNQTIEQSAAAGSLDIIAEKALETPASFFREMEKNGVSFGMGQTSFKKMLNAAPERSVPDAAAQQIFK